MLVYQRVVTSHKNIGVASIVLKSAAQPWSESDGDIHPSHKQQRYEVDLPPRKPL